jgi:hypothetical protein
MFTARSLKDFPGNPFTALHTDDEKLRTMHEDLICLGRHKTRGVPDDRYLDLADQLLRQGKHERASIATQIDPIGRPNVAGFFFE